MRAKRPYVIPLGEQEIGRELQIRISQPRGNVASAGFVLQRVGAATEETPVRDPELETQLRGLGYIE